MIRRIQSWLGRSLPFIGGLLLSAFAFLWRRLMFRTTFIAITGSVGKTTATACLGAILSAHYPTNRGRGWRNHRSELARIILRTRFHHRFTVIEVGTRAPGALRRAAWMINPDIVVVLRVLNVHSNAFPTINEMAAEKAQLLSRLSERGTAILNADDPLVLAMGERCRARIQTFGVSPDSFLRANDVSAVWPRRLSFEANCGNERSHVETNFLGEHLLGSALAALAAAVYCGVPLARAAEVLKQVDPVPGRMQPMQLPNGITVIRDEYNSSLPTLRAALDFLASAQASRRIVVVGDVFDSGQKALPRFREIGRLVAGAADLGIFLGHDASTAARAAVAAGMRAESAVVCKSLPQAANFLKAELRPGDLVLLHGWDGRHVERTVLAQLGDLGCWVNTCPKLMPCESCPELGLVRFQRG
jgi:UDP-N-acetylmuramoyl-tripeptide--D-alanyl-D-alanine ligase